MTKKLKILLTEPDGYSPKAIFLLKKLGEVITHPLNQKEFDKILPEVDILVVKLKIKINKDILKRAKNLKAIATNTTGLNHIDLEEAKKRGVTVVSLRGHTAFLEKIHATPELTFGLILSLIRKIPWAFESVKSGLWDRNKFAGYELNGKILGIVGFGRIGRIVSRYAKAFGMTVMACDPNVDEQAMQTRGAKKVSLEEIFKVADILSIHVLYEAELDRMIKEEHLKLMKPTALLINTARGELIDETALFKALKNKWLAGAAIDVMNSEDSAGEHLKQNPLLIYAKKHDNLLITPHLGGATKEAWEATEEYLAKLVLKHFNVKK